MRKWPWIPIASIYWMDVTSADDYERKVLGLIGVEYNRLWYDCMDFLEFPK